MNLNIIHHNEFPDTYVIRETHGFRVHWDALGYTKECRLDFETAIEKLEPICGNSLKTLGHEERAIGRVFCVTEDAAKTAEQVIREHLIGKKYPRKKPRITRVCRNHGPIAELDRVRLPPSPSQSPIVYYIAMHGPQKSGDLAPVFGKTKNQMKSLLSQLRLKGYIYPENPDSKYRPYWALTERGRAFVEEHSA